ncbi:MAG: tRNA (N6-isopentenyl adenosine(37)-C2)-methylthiotransferase MiaB [Oscillospiraceae bacterium]|nr:tRNA (N6-isopentenyl adenosine(37)-C2)-methylthiotransferase MiaB [Oscillospiraceae bacterium]
MKKACVITYGCRQNISDSEKIEAALEQQGYSIIEETAEADLVIFNTCAVREGAEERVYGNIGALKALKKTQPGMKIAVCGCMAARSEVQEKIKKSFPYVNLVFGTNDIHNLQELLEKAEKKRTFKANDNEQVHELESRRQKGGVIANVPIMYGCNNFCSYCIVPHVRGRERSRAAADILNEIRNLAEEGYKEVLLLGQNVNSYKETTPSPSAPPLRRMGIDFPELLCKVAEVDGIERIRFISSHPKDFSDKLIEVMASNNKICKQLHLPFQAGSNKVLADMNRGYTREHYISLIEKARAAMPNLAITSDVIVGFPTETQEDFEQSLELIKFLKLDSLFSFIYSKRSGTPAAEMDFALSQEQIKANFERLLAVQEKIASEINAKLLGTYQEVLVEGKSKNNENMWQGRTDGGKIVNFAAGDFVGDDGNCPAKQRADCHPPLQGSIVQVYIESTSPWALSGIIK